MMQKITTTEELRAAILILKVKQKEQEVILKDQFRTTYENLKPLNLIKNTFSQLITNPDIKGGIVNSLMGMAAGYLSKKVIIGSTYNPLKQLLGGILQMGVTGLVSKNADDIKTTLSDIIQKFISNKKEK